MATLSHRALRELILSFGGVSRLYAEMASCSALAGGGRFENYYVDTQPVPERTIVQLVAGSVDEFARGAAALAARMASGALRLGGVDLNFGCSAPEILRQGGGAAWLKKTDEAILAAARVRNILPGLALTAKLRAGWGGDPAALLSFCRGLESAGLDGLCLHPRLPSEGYGRPPRWDLVGLLARELGIPVTGNGDIRSERDADRRAGETGCARLMIGKEAARRPWIFALIEARRRDPSASMEIDLLETAERFVCLLEAHQPREFWKSRARRFFFYFCDNLHFAHHPRAAIQRSEGPREALAVFRAYLDANPDERMRIEGP